jgi:hypothetical protein
MSQASAKSGVLGVILKQLSHPLKLRLALCAAAIALWQASFVGPVQENAGATTTRIGAERKRAATAREIERLKNVLKPHGELVGATEDEQALMRHVIDRIRSSPLRLIDLKPEKAKSVGPFVAIGLHLSLEGKYVDIDQFLGWAEADSRMMRVDSIKLSPDTREPGRLHASLVLMALVDKAAPAAKTKGESGKAAPVAKIKGGSGKAAPVAKIKGESGKAAPAAKAGRESGKAK